MMRDPFDRRVRPVRRAERVVHVEIGERGQRGREPGVVLLLFGMEPQVLEQHDAAAAGVDHLHGVLAPALPMQSLTNSTGRPSSSVEMPGDRRQAELRVRLALRPAEMAGEDDRGAPLERVADRRQRRRDARVVGDPAVLQRNVEVDADEDALALEVEILIDSFAMRIQDLRISGFEILRS